MNVYTKILLAVFVVTAVLADNPDNSTTRPGGVKVARTALHVARSLDPDATETLSVRTRTGDVATLIVKKRGAKANAAVPFPVSITSGHLRVLEDDSSFTGAKHSSIPSPVSIYSSTSFLVSNNKSENVAKEVPTPATVQSPSRYLLTGTHKASSDVHDTNTHLHPTKRYLVPENENSPNSPSHSSNSNLMGVKPSDFIPEVRGAKSSEIALPAPVYVRSTPMYVKGEQQEFKKSRGLMRIDTDGIPIITGVRMPDDESDRQVWRNARVINGVLFPKEKSSGEQQINDQSEIIKKPQYENSKQPIYQEVPTIKKYSYQPYSATRDRIIQYINSINRKESMRNGGSSIDSNRARMLHFSNARSDEPDWLTTSEFQARILQYPSSVVYPTSLNNQPSRVSFEEGSRTPVLQYAHPELGVQPAKVARKHDAPGFENDEINKNQDIENLINDKDSTLAYFAQDIHSDRSPYAYEPGMETDEVDTEETSDNRSLHDKRLHNSDEELPNNWNNDKPMSYLKDNMQDSYGLGNDKYIKRYPYGSHSNEYSNYGKDNYNGYTYPPRYPYSQNYFSVQKIGTYRPFWERLGESIRDHVQTSMEKVQDLTRPVVEPLVEATQKISHNLGLSGGQRGQTMLQEKVGGAVSTYPVLLPALGLVAGGAALGLGAVAVGRFLDVDMIKKRSDETQDDASELSVEHKRAIEELLRNLNEREKTRRQEQNNDSEDKTLANDQTKVEKRSLNDGLILLVESEPDVKTVEGKREKRFDDQSLRENTGSRKLRSVPNEEVPTEYKHKVIKKMMDAHNEKMVKREKRSSGEENHLVHEEVQAVGHANSWATTPCAKRLFCDEVTRQGEDTMLLMEKKMASYLALVQHDANVSYHLSDVMDAIKRHDCSSFVCIGTSSVLANNTSNVRQHQASVLLPL